MREPKEGTPEGTWGFEGLRVEGVEGSLLGLRVGYTGGEGPRCIGYLDIGSIKKDV